MANERKLHSGFGHRTGQSINNFFYGLIHGDIFTKLSYIIMGLSNIVRGQVIKGLIFLVCEGGFITFMTLTGVKLIAGLRHLGTVTRGWYFDESLGIDVMRENGDNSMLILLYGVLAIFVIIAFIGIYISSVKSGMLAEKLKKEGKRLPDFFDDVLSALDKNFHKTLLTIPLLGLTALTVIPLVYMICIAFTNYDRNHQVPANLFTWIGFDNFKTMLFNQGGTNMGHSFWPILGWTLFWAVAATFTNYFFGIIIALMINKKGIKGKSIFRTIFVLSIAVPQFVSLLVMKSILAEQGTLNQLLLSLGWIDKAVPFLTDVTWARASIIIVNLWIGIPYTILIVTGILGNIPDYLYESARLDGASAFVMFRKITMPYMLFITAPYLITQFISNINNFNVIYFLTAGNPATLDYYQAGKTDLLVTWLYKLTVNTRDYSYASTIGIIVFVISATLSILTFRRTGSYKGEGDFQ